MGSIAVNARTDGTDGGAESRRARIDTDPDGRPSVCFVGPMLGRNPGVVTTQGEVLADLFAAEGWQVRETSTCSNRYVRLVDTLSCLVRWRRSVDVVVLSVFSGPSFVVSDAVSWLAQILSLPTVQVLHGGNLPSFADRHPGWVGRVLGRADVVVAPSPYLALVGDRVGIAVDVIPNAIELGSLAWAQRSEIRPHLLWMRTYHPIYNPLRAVRVAHLLRERWPDLTMRMGGQDKGLRTAVEAEVDRLGLSDVVRIDGFLGPREKREAFTSADVYLHTNHVDNAPVSVIEAAAAGLPIVATEVGGIGELLEDEVSALLVADDDDEAMVRAVDRLLRDPGLVRRLSGNAKAMAERSSWPAVRGQWTGVFDRALAGRMSNDRWRSAKPSRKTRHEAPAGAGVRDGDGQGAGTASGDPMTERDRINALYRSYHASGRAAERWDSDAPGNRCILAEREVAMRRLLATLPPDPLVLEIGCGGGTVLSQMRTARPDARLVGIDLDAERMSVTGPGGRVAPLAVADATTLPFGGECFDAVVTFTVFSSILDATIRGRIVDEIDRVLAPDGRLLWYDFRYPSPSNRSVAPLDRNAVGRLFPGWQADLSTVTLLPPVARRLGQFDRRFYPTLTRAAFLRSHLVGELRRASA